MTWHNLPCDPTLPAIFAACPNGWAEVVVSNQNGNPTSDPPQDASRSVDIARIFGVENADMGSVIDLMLDIDEDGMPVGYPRGDVVLLVRIDHAAERCSECGQGRPEGHVGFLCCPGYSQNGGCSGAFTVTTKACAMWGTDGRAVFCDGSGAPEYTNPEHHRARIEDGLVGEATAGRWKAEPPPQAGYGDMWQQILNRYVGNYEPDEPMTRVLDIFRQRREMGIAKYGTPLQAGNGRNPLRDLLDETLDRIVYIEQAITEVPARKASLRTEQDNDVELVEVLLGMYGFEDSGEKCRADYLRSIGAKEAT